MTHTKTPKPKWRYLSRERAVRDARGLQLRTGFTFIVYYCGPCESWHVGKNSRHHIIDLMDPEIGYRAAFNLAGENSGESAHRLRAIRRRMRSLS